MLTSRRCTTTPALPAAGASARAGRRASPPAAILRLGLRYRRRPGRAACRVPSRPPPHRRRRLDDAAAAADGLLVVSQVRFLDAEQHRQTMQQARQGPAFYRQGREISSPSAALPARADVHGGSRNRVLQGLRGLLHVFGIVEDSDDGVLHEPPPFDEAANDRRSPGGPHFTFASGVESQGATRPAPRHPQQRWSARGGGRERPVTIRCPARHSRGPEQALRPRLGNKPRMLDPLNRRGLANRRATVELQSRGRLIDAALGGRILDRKDSLSAIVLAGSAEDVLHGMLARVARRPRCRPA